MSKVQQQPPSRINPNTSTDNNIGTNAVTIADTDVKPASTMNTIMKDITATMKISSSSTISSTLEVMLDKYDELDEDSRKMLIQHAITTDNAMLQ
jgi:hypothetical protein